METILDNLKKLAEGNIGTRWYKANLHVHAENNDPDAIIRAAEEADVELLGITDHQTFKYCERVIESAKGSGVAVLPGIEITSLEGVHLLALFPAEYSTRQQDKLIGWLEVKPEADTRAACQRSVEDILRKVAREGGIVVTPHPFTSGIGLLDSARKIGTRLGWLETGLIRLMELSDTHLDKVKFVGVDDRGNWVNRYVLESSTESQIASSTYCLAPLNRGDAHKPEEIEGGCTWLRMGEPSVDGLRQVAFEPRTRISREPPRESTHSRILGLRVRGGYCDGEELRFNGSLNCIVGQNYAGKSAVFDFIRFALGHENQVSEDSRKRLSQRLYGILQDGGEVELFLEHERGLYVCHRKFEPEIDGEGPSVTVTAWGPDTHAYVRNEEEDRLEPAPEFEFPIEVYEQGKINRLRNDLDRQLQMLDEFAGTEQLVRERDRVLQNLDKSAQMMAPLADECEELNTESKTLPSLQNELLEKEKHLPEEEELELWAAADEIVRELEAAVGDLELVRETLEKPRTVTNQEKEGGLSTLFQQQLPSLEKRDVAERDLLEGWLAVANRTLERIDSAKSGIIAAVEELSEASEDLRGQWESARQAREDEVNEQLAEAGVTSPKEITTRVKNLRVEISRIEKKVKPRMVEIEELLVEEDKRRTRLISELRRLNSEITARRIAKAQELTEKLEGHIKVEVQPHGNVTRYKEVLGELCDQITTKTHKIRNRQQQLALIAEGMTPLDLAEALQNEGRPGGEEGEGQETVQDRCGVTDNTVAVLRGIADDITLLNRLETTETPDVPRIKVRRTGETSYVDLGTGLSPGEQSAAILTLALQTREMPLIVDQPEDELGYKYVVHLIVPKILDAKSSRQLLVVTHNANVPVLGDADYVVRMQNQPHPERVRACTVMCEGTFEGEQVTTALLELEGGEQAFKFRQDRYGLPSVG